MRRIRRALAIAAVLAVALAGMVGLNASPAFASTAGPGHCAGVNTTLAYPVYQEQNLGVNQPWGPVYVFQNTPILIYHDANGNENIYGSYLGWVSYERVYHDYFTWPAQPGQSQITTVPPIHFGDFILVLIPIAKTYPLGNCVISYP